MAKKYQQTAKDRRDESKGMKKAMKKKGRSRGMICEDWSQPALLPQEVMRKYWGPGGYYDNNYVPDLFSGVQDQLDQSAHEYSKIKKVSKY